MEPVEHIVCDVGAAMATGVGLTVITTFKGDPWHPLAMGVIVYVTCAGKAVPLISVCIMLFPEPDEVPETLPAGVIVTVQLKVVVGVILERFIFVDPAEQIV